jgi:hypothetical protein
MKMSRTSALVTAVVAVVVACAIPVIVVSLLSSTQAVPDSCGIAFREVDAFSVLMVNDVKANPNVITPAMQQIINVDVPQYHHDREACLSSREAR